MNIDSEDQDDSGAPSVKNADSTRKPRGRPFERGNSGRPRGARNKIPRDVKRRLEEDLPQIVEALVEKARSGHVHAALAILRVFVPPAKEEISPVMIRLPNVTTAQSAADAMANIIDAASNGKISPDGAEKFVAMLRAAVQTIESADLEARISRLEALSQESSKS